jgi:hypothetical protein
LILRTPKVIFCKSVLLFKKTWGLCPEGTLGDNSTRFHQDAVAFGTYLAAVRQEASEMELDPAVPLIEADENDPAWREDHA